MTKSKDDIKIDAIMIEILGVLDKHMQDKDTSIIHATGGLFVAMNNLIKSVYTDREIPIEKREHYLEDQKTNVLSLGGCIVQLVLADRKDDGGKKTGSHSPQQ